MTRVLIVDDKEDNRYLLEKLLQGNGFETITACDGAEALDAALKNPPDIIISDILMPVMDGFTLCREWKKDAHLKKIPFVFYTATYTDQKDEDFARALGADCFVVKPKQPEEFLKIVKNILAALRKGTLHSASILEPEEKVFLREYNEALVRKLENKMLEAEQAEQKIKQYATELEKRIEELKRAEAEIKESEVNLKSLIENSKQAIWSIDNKYHFIIFNSFYCKEHISASNAELKKGMNALDVLSPEVRLFWKEKYETALSGQRIIFEFSEMNGHAPHFFEVFLNPIVSDGNIMGVSAIKIDITARKHAEEKIAEQARLLDVALDAIIVRDMNDRLLYWNRAAEQLYGWTFEEAKEMSLTTLIADIDLARLEQAKRVLLESGTWEGELHQQTGKGGLRVIQSRWVMVRDK
jgi:PAS domain S-box-containing protein